MKRLLKALCLLLLTCSSYCEKEPEPDAEIICVNTSDRTVVFWDVFYADTSLTSFGFAPTEAEYYSQHIAAPNDTVRFERSYRLFFKEDGNTVTCFTFDADTLEQVPWERVVSEYKVLRRYDLTLDSLERRNWIITYP